MVKFVPVRKILKIVLKKCDLKQRTRLTKKLKEREKDAQEVKRYYGVVCVVAVILIIIFIQFFVGNYIRSCFTEKFVSLEEINNIVIEQNVKESKIKVEETNLPLCYYNTTGLGEISVNKTITKCTSQVLYPHISAGGYYRPEGCKTMHKVAILVPYRDRQNNLDVFLYNIHSFLIRQKIEYRIFVIEQKGTDNFNRGKLFNAGFFEMKKFGQWRCVIFHDVDLLPLDNRILYSCPIWSRHMCAAVVEVKDPKFRSLFGGVSSMDVQHFIQVNGYSNLYWGWGGEDNDLFWRIRAVGLPILKNSKIIARYTSLEHSEQTPNPLRFSLLTTATMRFKKEGLSTLKYKVESIKLNHLYTHIAVDINPDKENTTKML